MVSFVQIASYLPSIREPEKEQSLKEMLMWTGVVLVIYFALGSINVSGANSQAVEQALTRLRTFQTLLGAQIGSVITLGIGPIVTSSIVLQMLVGSDLLDWNTNSQKGKQRFQAAQKVLAYSLTVIQASGWVVTGNFGSPAQLGPGVVLFLTAQLIAGGWLIILMDDLVQKWGFGSGTGLFIAAGVSKAVYISSVSPLTRNGDIYWSTTGSSAPVGALFSFLNTLNPLDMLPIISTILVFAAVVYMQSMKVEIPLTFGDVRGFGQKWPLKFLYTSNMPVILIAALITNFRILGSSLAGQNGCSILGCFEGGQATSGLIALLQAPTSTFTTLLETGTITAGGIGHILFYTAVYAFGSIMFSIFWMRTSGQDADSVAEQIQQTGMKVPGFRKDKRVIKKVLNRYIPSLTILSGFAVGLLAAVANMTSAAGGGTGILLTVMILYKMYEELAQKHMEELHPALKDFLG
jgi:preprotein translocase subunit SecY